MVSSGVTYEKNVIEKYLEIKYFEFDQLKLEVPETNETIEDYLKCPVTYKTLDPGYMIPNKIIKRATKDFIKMNPWAYELDPWKTMFKTQSVI